MFLHTHPYEPFLFQEATKVIVGTLPPPRFTTGELKPDDVDFCYGSRNGMLWPILDRIFGLNLKFETTPEAMEQRKKFLLEQQIGVCDIVASAERQKVDASDLGMQNVQLRDLVGYLRNYPNLKTVLFMGGNSKNGPEYFFRKQLKEQGLSLQVVSNEVPRIHELMLSIPSESKKNTKLVRTVSLTAPSGAANRAVGSLQTYKDMKSQNPDFNTMDFRVMQYRPFFES
ncbi:uracil-DNA glycosylase family protein [Flagellimonas flava]|uniref:uracil-DNA glycosylase family protein n=1 Tax=Flagellimonas flava TaxID=570519 RepID=UPI003D64F875